MMPSGGESVQSILLNEVKCTNLPPGGGAGGWAGAGAGGGEEEEEEEEEDSVDETLQFQDPIRMFSPSTLNV